MAEYDGSIRINTEIDTKKASSQLLTLQNRITKAADKVSSLRSKMDSLRNTKIPTQEYQEISAQIEKAEQKFNKLLEKQEQMQREGKDNGTSWQRLNDQMDEIGNEIRYAKGELQDLVETGKAFTLGSSTGEFSNLSRQLKYAKNELASLNQKHYELNIKQAKIADGSKNIGNTVRKSFESIGNGLKKANAFVDSFGKRMKNIAQRILPSFRNETERSNRSISKFGTRLKSLLSGIFIFNVISAGFRNMFSGIKEGFANFYEQNNVFKASVDNLNSRLLQLKNTLASAFAPIVQIAIPYIETLVAYLTKAANAVAQLIAALLGKSTYTRAAKTSAGAIKDTSSAIGDLKDDAEDAEEAMDKMLSPLDKLNVLNSNNEKKSGTDTGSGKGTPGSGIGAMFEEVPVDSYFKDMANKIKDVLSRIFAPLKKAWNREGKFVMNSWKYALNEIRKLIKDIGRDFLIVWQQNKTVNLFSNVLHIIGDIGLIVGNLAKNFRNAWNENQTGLRILENIRDIFGVIVENIRKAADFTVKWSEKLNFSLLLKMFEKFTESLVPVVDNLSGIITDFYEQVLLPLGKWTIENGLPGLLDILTKFNEKVRWNELRQGLSDFWDALEPFAETVGEGLIIFIDKCANALADFLNSQEFKEFLDEVADWMSKVEPEDVAKAIERIAEALIGLKLALVGFSAVKTVAGVFDTIIRFLSFFGVGGAGAGAAKGIGEVTAAVGGLTTALTALSGIAIGDLLYNWGLDEFSEMAIELGHSEEQVNALKDSYGGILGPFKAAKDACGLLVQAYQGLPVVMADSSLGAAALDEAMKKAADGYIYSDEQMKKMQKTWELSNEDMEMLRQTMLDANPDLRNLAENFGLINSSAEELSDISFGIEYLGESIGNTKSKLDYLTDSSNKMSAGSRAFFSEVRDGLTDLGTYQEKISDTSGEVEKFSLHIESASKNIGNSVSEGMNKAKQSTEKACGEMKNSVSNNMSESKKNVSDKLGSIKSTWYDTFDSLKSKVESVFESISEKISGALDNAKSKIDELKSKISGGFSFKSSSGAMGLSLQQAALSNIAIPGYATGQVIPRTMKQHLAVLGDNNHETEVVSPLSTIEQAVENVINRLGLSGYTGNQEEHIHVEIDGNEVFKAVRKKNRQFKKSTGKSALT